MEAKVRVVTGPVATDQDGTVVSGGIAWYPGSAYDSQVYIPSLANGTRPVAAHSGAPRTKESMAATARKFLDKDRAIFRGLA
jgi:hypothetical protein